MSKTWSIESNITECNDWHPKKIEIIRKKTFSPVNMIIHRGGVYDVNLGVNIGGEKNKLRPCLVISKNILNKGHTVVIVPLSSKFYKDSKGKNPRYKNDYLLKKETYDKLDKDSVVSFTDIRTVDKSRIGRKKFDVNEEDLNKMLKNLTFTYGF